MTIRNNNLRSSISFKYWSVREHSRKHVVALLYSCEQNKRATYIKSIPQDL